MHSTIKIYKNLPKARKQGQTAKTFDKRKCAKSAFTGISSAHKPADLSRTRWPKEPNAWIQAHPAEPVALAQGSGTRRPQATRNKKQERGKSF